MYALHSIWILDLYLYLYLYLYLHVLHNLSPLNGQSVPTFHLFPSSHTSWEPKCNIYILQLAFDRTTEVPRLFKFLSSTSCSRRILLRLLRPSRAQNDHCCLKLCRFFTNKKRVCPSANVCISICIDL